MSLFKKTSYKFYLEKDVETLRANFKSNVAQWDDFRTLKISRTGKLYEGVISNEDFMFKRINTIYRSYVIQYSGKIYKKDSGTEIVINVEIEPALIVLMLVMLVLLGIIELGCIIYSIMNFKITLPLVLFSIIFLIGIKAFQLIKPSLSSVQQKQLLRVFY